MDTIIKAKKGNKKAIKQIVKENIIQVYRLIFLHTKYEEDAKNILRDTIDFIYENFSKVDNEKIILWMYKIAIINTNNFLKCNGMVEKNNSLNSYYYNNKIKIDDAAHKLGICRSEICKLFRYELHTTFTEYISRLRIEHAIELLNSSEANITQISELVGFNSSSYFTEIFKRFYNISPLEYKNQYITKKTSKC